MESEPGFAPSGQGNGGEPGAALGKAASSGDVSRGWKVRFGQPGGGSRRGSGEQEYPFLVSRTEQDPPVCITESREIFEPPDLEGSYSTVGPICPAQNRRLGHDEEHQQDQWSGMMRIVIPKTAGDPNLGNTDLVQPPGMQASFTQHGA